jgi:hypothetical protein
VGPFPDERTVGHTLSMTSDPYDRQRAFAEAELRADIGALQSLLADDFRSIGDQGYLLDKAQWLDKFVDFSYTSLQSTDIEVSCYDRAAIVRYIQRSISVWRGQEMTSTSRVSQTWIEQTEDWRLAVFSSAP